MVRWPPCEGGLLIDMSHLDEVAIDPSLRCAVVPGGARWRGVLDAADVHGLTGLAGSSPDVGVVGYTLGGGAGWLSRRHGLCSDTMTAAEVVTIDGDRRWVDEKTEPDLFWALRGSGGNFGIVTAIRLRLLPILRDLCRRIVLADEPRTRCLERLPAMDRDDPR